MNVEILMRYLDRGLCKGVGAIDGAVCLEAAVALASGEGFTDRPSCVHPIVNAYAIALNDAPWSSPAARSAGLRDFALAHVGTAGIDGVAFARALALRTVREILPITLRAVGLEEHAVACECAVDLDAAERAAWVAAGAAERAAWVAARAADAAAWAAWAAETARAAARAPERAPEAAEAAARAGAAWAAAAGDRILALSARIATEILQGR